MMTIMMMVFERMIAMMIKMKLVTFTPEFINIAQQHPEIII